MISIAIATLDAVEAIITIAACSLILKGPGLRYLNQPLVGIKTEVQINMK